MAFFVLPFLFGCVPEAEAILMIIGAPSALIGEGSILRK